MKIGMFDSGIGGLNVLKEFINKYPNNHYYYYGDTLNVPYGDKDKDTLLEFSSRIVNFFEEIKVDLIIIACGTVSSTCLNELRNITTIPILDIISPTINYLKKINLEKIVVLGTNRTINSHIFKNSLNNLVEVATPEFVPMLENNSIDTDIIKKYVVEFKNYDAIVLGCTHYPLLILELKKYVSSNTIMIDMGKVIVDSMNISSKDTYNLDLYFTKIDDNLRKNIEKIIKSTYKIHLV
ncbi:MAG: glutamate racemase [Bacilli bacterium]|nr:glutamate racemase [Bacilli bacterium]